MYYHIILKTDMSFKETSFGHSLSINTKVPGA